MRELARNGRELQADLLKPGVAVVPMPSVKSPFIRSSESWEASVPKIASMASRRTNSWRRSWSAGVAHSSICVSARRSSLRSARVAMPPSAEVMRASSWSKRRPSVNKRIAGVHLSGATARCASRSRRGDGRARRARWWKGCACRRPARCARRPTTARSNPPEYPARRSAALRALTAAWAASRA